MSSTYLGLSSLFSILGIALWVGAAVLAILAVVHLGSIARSLRELVALRRDRFDT